tara:strand:+ start:346 stop:2253 length:1908 start_codon:yes stop_codon:yes gene_type:complete
MLAKEYELGMILKKDISKYSKPPKGWIMSEKFDGYRALFRYEEVDGVLVGKFYSRNGKSFNSPEWFLYSMPPPELLGDKILDGELWAGRDNFQLMGIVRKKVPVPEEWLNIQYQVYDITNSEGGFVERLKELKRIVDFTGKSWSIRLKNEEFYIPEGTEIPPPLVYATQKRITSESMMKKFYKDIIDNGGEGIMIKHPLSSYENGRSNYMLKYKPAFDREAEIIDYKMGDPESKYKGMLGSFICRPLNNHDTYMSVDEDDNHIFTLSGMDDKIRKNYKRTHPVGTIITFECSGFTDKGVPRFGRYLRIRDDVIVKKHNSISDREKLDQVLEIFTYLEKYYKGNYDTFRAKTYMGLNKVLKTLESDSDLEPVNLKKIKGIGQGTIDRIKEIVDTGTLQEYEKLKDKKSPLEGFLKIHGVGKQHAKKLVTEGFKTIDDLRKCKNIQDYLNDTQIKGLQYYDDMQVRIPYEEIEKHEVYLKNVLNKIDPKADLTIAGSYRRKRPDSGDIDLLLKASNKRIYDKFIDTLVQEGYLTCQLARGNKKYMGMGKIGISPCHRRIDIMYTKPEEYPFAILYFTGSGDFNVRMREDALKQGYTMNEYSIKHTDNKEKVDKVFLEEREIFDFLGYEYLEPENRIQ